MQKPISDKIQIGQTLNPARDYGGVSSINDEGTLENIISKVDKSTNFIKTGQADEDLSRYYPNILPITRQSQIAGELPRKAYASETYTDKKQFEFTIEMTANTYSNYSSMLVCIPIKFTKKTSKIAQLDGNMTTVNNFFGHWFTNIDVRRYPDDMNILPTNNSVSIANYSNAQMKYLSEKSVKKLLKTMLYRNKPVYLTGDNTRRPNNDATDANRTDPNLTYRLKELKAHLFKPWVYKIPLLYLCDLGKVNFAITTNTKIVLTLERNMNKLFESNKKVAAIPDNPNALINVYDRPYISYQEINLTHQAVLYGTGILRSETALRHGILPAPFQQEFEISTGTQNFTCTFKGALRQTDWLEISIVYDKSYHHSTIYDSYDVELAAKQIKTIKFDNASSTYSLTGKLSDDLEKEDDKYQLYSMLAAFTCAGSSAAPLTQYINNPIYQELTEEDEFCENERDDRIYVDMRRSKGYTDELEKTNRDDSKLALTINLKQAAKSKLRYRINAWSQGEYWYLLSNRGYILSYKNYSISKSDTYP